MKHPDLFTPVAAPPLSGRASPGIVDVAALLPARPRAWLDVLARAPLVPVELVVSTLWTGMVLEQLSYPGQGTRALHRDDRIVELGVGVQRAVRVVHLTRQEAAALHVRRPLVLLGYDGPWCARLRFGNAGQAGPTGYPAANGLLGVLAGLREPA